VKGLIIILSLMLFMQAGLFRGQGVVYAEALPVESLPAIGSDADEPPLAEAPAVKPQPQSSIEDIGPAGLLELARNLAAQGEAKESEKTYKLLFKRFPESKKANVAYYELGLLLYKNGGAVEARSYLERVTSSWWVEPALREKTRVLLREIDSLLKRGAKESKGPAIGLIMPLKGRYAPYGEAALKSVLLAAGIFGPAVERPVDVIVRDVGESPAEGAGAVTTLAEKKNVVGIVGPLLNSTAYQSAARAEALSIPLITLSRKEDISGAGGYVFRNSLSPSEEARAVAEYAVNALGNIKFAVLYPEDLSGKIMAKTFMDTVIGLGGEVTAVSSYKRDTKDFSNILVDLFKIETDEVQEGRRMIKEYFPSAEVDALYIPDDYRTISLITPYIKYYNIEDLQLLGSSGWDSKRLVEMAGRGVDGAVFVDGFFAGSKRESSSVFALHFRDAYGRSPGELEAEAYDATGILIKAIDSDNPGRRAVRDRLLEMSGYEGAGGPMSFDRFGGSVKKPFILTVKGRSIVEAEYPKAPEQSVRPEPLLPDTP